LPDPVASTLAELGWDDGWTQALAAADDPALAPGRVSRVDRGACTVLTGAGPLRATNLPDVAVGDWVTVRPGPAAGDTASVATILPRRCSFRRSTGTRGGPPQVVAANIDTVLLVTAVDRHLSVRHLERYLALAWQSGAVPVVVVSKADLASAGVVAGRVTEARSVALDVDVQVVSVATGQGLDTLAPYLAPGRTVALLGLSGAGKSTLVNFLAGDDILATGLVRADGQGRHTTTHRELVVLPGGGMVIDTPGMRALSVAGADDGVRRAFADVEALAERCRFDDCGHAGDAGCAVRAAVAAGRLGPERLDRWLSHRGQPEPEQRRQAARLRVEERKRGKVLAKAARWRANGDPATTHPPAAPRKPSGT
jgi:ribosome biogenesis GTPase